MINRLPLALSRSVHAKAVREARARQKELRKKVALAVRGPSKGFVEECRQWSIEIGLALVGAGFLGCSALGGLESSPWTHGVKGLLLPVIGMGGVAFLLIPLALAAMAIQERRRAFAKAWRLLVSDPNNLWVKVDFDRCERRAAASLEAFEIERAIARGRGSKTRAPATGEQALESKKKPPKKTVRRL